MNVEDIIHPADDPEAVLIREVYARFGLAVFMAQVLEHAVVNALLVLHFMPTMPEYADKAEWEAAFDDFYTSEFGKTFGNMLKTLMRLGIAPQALIERLNDAKKTRDMLVHSFFRERDLAFMTQAGRADMIAACDEAVAEFKACDIALDEFCAPFRERYGMTDEWVERAYQAMLAQARTSNPN